MDKKTDKKTRLRGKRRRKYRRKRKWGSEGDGCGGEKDRGLVIVSDTIALLYTCNFLCFNLRHEPPR